MHVHRTQAFFAAHAARTVHLASTWAAINANQQRARNNALVLILSDVHLGDVSLEFVNFLGVETTARRVMISRRTQQHVIERRQISAQIDVDLAVHRMSEALANLCYWLLPQREQRVFEVISYVPSAQRYLLVALKLVRDLDSKSKQDEWWVKTAFPYSQKKLRKASSAGKLRELPNKALHATALENAARER